jgi:hypothetical protein
MIKKEAKDIAFDLFQQSGKIGYYLLYRELDEKNRK